MDRIMKKSLQMIWNKDKTNYQPPPTGSDWGSCISGDGYVDCGISDGYGVGSGDNGGVTIKYSLMLIAAHCNLIGGTGGCRDGVGDICGAGTYGGSEFGSNYRNI